MIHSVKDFVDKKMNNKLICFNIAVKNTVIVIIKSIVLVNNSVSSTLIVEIINVITHEINISFLAFSIYNYIVITSTITNIYKISKNIRCY